MKSSKCFLKMFFKVEKCSKFCFNIKNYDAKLLCLIEELIKLLKVLKSSKKTKKIKKS